MHVRNRRPALLLAVLLVGSAPLGGRAGLEGAPPARKAAPVPAYQAELVAPGVLSTPDDELGAAFEPDGRTLYFTLRSPTTTTRPVQAICVSHQSGGLWGEPEIAPFSGRYNDTSPALSPDGKRLVFTSDRPVPGRAGVTPNAPVDYDLWAVDRRADGRWGEPRHLGLPVDTPTSVEQSAALAADGTLYFSSNRPGSKGAFDLYRARPAGDGYGAPEPLAEVASPASEAQPAISPDGSLLVFSAAGRPDTRMGGGFPYNKADLYASFRTTAGDWGPPRRLGPAVNTTANEGAPSFSPDGLWLYFSSERGFGHLPMTPRATGGRWAAERGGVLSGAGNLYRIDARAVRELAPAPEPPPYAAAGPLAAPRLFAPGTISSPEDEFGGAFEPDGRTVFFDRTIPRSQLYTIFVSRFAGGAWSRPEVAPFSGTWRDSDPVLSPEGDRLYFVSDRPRLGRPVRDFDAFVVRRGDDGAWGEAEAMEAPINGPGSEYFVSESRDGTLYFTSSRPGSKGPIDAWRARFTGNGYAEPENLGDAINGPEWTTIEAYVAPDESYVLIGAFGHADGAGNCDLFVSYRQGNGWSKLLPLTAVNTPAREYSPRLSPDGKYLFYSSERGLPTDRPTDRALTYRELKRGIGSIENGLGNLYQVELAAVLPPPPKP